MYVGDIDSAVLKEIDRKEDTMSKLNGLDATIIKQALLGLAEKEIGNAIVCGYSSAYYLRQVDTTLDTLNKVQDMFDLPHYKREGFKVVVVEEKEG